MVLPEIFEAFQRITKNLLPRVLFKEKKYRLTPGIVKIICRSNFKNNNIQGNRGGISYKFVLSMVNRSNADIRGYVYCAKVHYF